MDFDIDLHTDTQYVLKTFCCLLFAISVPKSRYLRKLNFGGTPISPQFSTWSVQIFCVVIGLGDPYCCKISRTLLALGNGRAPKFAKFDQKLWETWNLDFCIILHTNRYAYILSNDIESSGVYPLVFEKSVGKNFFGPPNISPNFGYRVPKFVPLLEAYGLHIPSKFLGPIEIGPREPIKFFNFLDGARL